MTKFMEWVFVGLVVISSWIAVLMGKTHTSCEWYYKWFPILFIFAVGIYSAFVVLYRVMTFNNCESAAAELQNQIKEATEDLKNRGINFKTEIS